MTQRDKNSIGLIVLVMMMVAFFALFIPMFRFSIPRLFMHDWLGMDTPGIEQHLSFTLANLTRMLPLGLMYVMWAFVAIWTYRDAERRNLNGLLWALFVFVGNIIGLIIYLILRGGSSDHEVSPGATRPPAPSTTPCPECGHGVQDSFVVCPYCAHSLARSCDACGKRLEIDWKACPHCGQAVAGD
jgi:hypothetical protein